MTNMLCTLSVVVVLAAAALCACVRACVRFVCLLVGFVIIFSMFVPPDCSQHGGRWARTQ